MQSWIMLSIPFVSNMGEMSLAVFSLACFCKVQRLAPFISALLFFSVPFCECAILLKALSEYVYFSS